MVVFAAGANHCAAAVSQAPELGILTKARGQVSVQGAPVLPGATVTPGDVIAAGTGSAAQLSFGPHYSLTVLPDTELSILQAATAKGFNLRRGSVVVQEQSKDSVRVLIPGAWIAIKGANQSGALCEIASLGTSSKVSLQHGLAEIHGAGAPVLLHAGEWARLEVGGRSYDGPTSGAPQGGAQSAGKVTREIPRGTVDRRGQSLPLNLNDPVELNDQVHTLQSGRLQITLLDGSVLNIGSRSEMKIVRNDAQAQQTEIELAVGKIRADVQKINKSGGKFEVRTKTAVIGVVGTSFAVSATDKRTRVCGVEGDTEVKSSDPALPNSVHLLKNMCVDVLPGAPPGSPIVSPSEISSLLNETTVGGTAASGAAPAAVAGGHTVLVATVVTVGAVAGTFGGLAGAGVFDSSKPPTSP